MAFIVQLVRKLSNITSGAKMKTICFAIVGLIAGISTVSFAAPKPNAAIQTIIDKVQIGCSDDFATIRSWDGSPAHLVQGGYGWAGDAFVKVEGVSDTRAVKTLTSPDGKDTYELRFDSYFNREVYMEVRYTTIDSKNQKVSAVAMTEITEATMNRLAQGLPIESITLKADAMGSVPEAILFAKDEGKAMIQSLHLKDGDFVSRGVSCSVESK
jgi:hypothetical protein